MELAVIAGSVECQKRDQSVEVIAHSSSQSDDLPFEQFRVHRYTRRDWVMGRRFHLLP